MKRKKRIDQGERQTRDRREWLPILYLSTYLLGVIRSDRAERVSPVLQRGYKLAWLTRFSCHHSTSASSLLFYRNGGQVWWMVA